MPTHAEERVLLYTPEQLFALVADIERYPEFLPWCVGARIKERQANFIVADLIIGFRMFRERFTSRVSLCPPRRIDVAYAEGPFRYLNNHWTFTPVAGGSKVGFFVDFEF
jgi:coenzyme Q-binding protein COQ10